MKNAIRSRRVVTPSGVRPASVAFEDGVITSVTDSLEGEDFGDRYILPGLVDTHVHINEPGRTHWEGFETATRAAAAGGITCVVDMPLNSIPATTTVASLEEKRASAIGKCLVDYAFWGGCVPGNSGELSGLAEAGVRGFKCFMVPSGVAEFEMVDEDDLRSAMPVIAASGLPLLVHAEFPAALVPADGQVWTRYSEYLASRPDACELQAIELLIRLCRQYRCRIHIVHLASAKPLQLLAAARMEGLPITVETCPHYLCFTAEDIGDGATQFKCAPPIRGLETREALWQALKKGLIDLVATDHSPCPPGLKLLEKGDFAEAWGGIASLSLAFPALHTAAVKRGFGLFDLAYWLSYRPAALAGLRDRKGSLSVGLDADFVVFDPDYEWDVTVDTLYFRHAVSPYVGQRLQGRVERTIVRGECVYCEGSFAGNPAGRECRV